MTVFSLSRTVERDVEGNRSWVAPRGMGGLLICWLGIALICTQKNEWGRTPLDVAVGNAKKVSREWARRFKGEAPPPPRGYIEIEPLDGEVCRGGADR